LKWTFKSLRRTGKRKAILLSPTRNTRRLSRPTQRPSKSIPGNIAITPTGLPPTTISDNISNAFPIARQV